MNLGLIFCTVVDLIIVYHKNFCPEFFKTFKNYFRFFFQKKGYMELELHMSTLG
jgi:hypothetical protein